MQKNINYPVLKGVNDLFTCNSTESESENNSQPYYPDRKDFFFFIPQNLDLDGLFHKAAEKKIPLYKIVKFLALIGRSIVQKRKLNSRREYEFYVKTHGYCDVIKELGNEYLKYYKFLEEQGVLNRTPYTDGENMKYGYQYPFRNQRLKIKVFNANKLTQKIRPRYKDRSTEKYCGRLTKPFKKGLFGIDYVAAEQQLFEKYCDFNVQNSFGGYVLEDDKSILKYGAYHNSLLQMAKFLNGEFYFSRSNFESEIKRRKALKIRKDKNRKLRKVRSKRRFPTTKPSGRFYSSFSFLPKTVRNLLHYDGEILKQIDVKNCVMYILSCHLKNNNRVTPQMIKTLTSKGYYASYVYKLVKQYLSSKGIDLFLQDFRDIQLSINCFSEITFGDKVISGPFQDVRSLLFQLGYPFCNSLDSVKILADEDHIMSTKLATTTCRTNNTSEIQVSSTTLLRNSVQTGVKNWLPSLTSSEAINYLTSLTFTKATVLPYMEVEDRRRIKPFYKSDSDCQSLSGAILPYYMSIETLQGTMDRELERFQKMAVNGLFYENFIPDLKMNYSSEQWKEKYEELLGNPYDGSADADRELTKQLLMALIYAKNGNKNYEQVKWAFVKPFPNVYLLMQDLKSSEHKKFAHDLFNLEANVMIDEIAVGLLTKRVPTFTVHDCIAVKESDEKSTNDFMLRVFKNKFGIAPKTDIDNKKDNDE